MRNYVFRWQPSYISQYATPVNATMKWALDLVSVSSKTIEKWGFKILISGCLVIN